MGNGGIEWEMMEWLGRVGNGVIERDMVGNGGIEWEMVE